MKAMILGFLFVVSFSAFAQQEEKCSKAVGALASAASDYVVAKHNLKLADKALDNPESEHSSPEQMIALEAIVKARKASLNIYATMISVSCMNANMLRSGSLIRNEINARFPDENPEQIEVKEEP